MTQANRKPKRGIFLTETEKDVLMRYLEKESHSAEESKHYKECSLCRVAVKLRGPR